MQAYGIETYFLNLTTNPDAMRVAAFENATSTHQMSDLQNILSDILKNSKINESSRLARQVHHSLITGLEKNYSHIKSLGVKQAPFYVLIGAQMPAILVEMAFISNPNDAQRLKNDRFLEKIANDISSGIKLYIQNNTAGL
jgi:N-acetylmuramoyl-L-alanine amidase